MHTPKTEEHGYPFTTEWKLCDSEDECNPSDCFERQPLYTAQPAPVVPEGLRLALSNAGIADPESDEMLAATHEKYTQMLVTWVRDRKPFRPAPVVNAIDETLIEALRLVQCMLDDYLERNYGHAQEWIRHISAKMEDYSEQHGDDAYSVISAAMLQSFGNSEQLNSPATSDCWCRTCRPVTMSDMRFVVCPDCGNKRCPHANDHRNACTGSNEPGQIGSAYPAAP
ncbi:hypothetical protein ACE6HT_13045 [Citrobacter freundii]|uniref:hypothetical protein n=1 Tax=Citrobacter freundii TaxID=546 RepID=UPI0035D124C6